MNTSQNKNFASSPVSLGPVDPPGMGNYHHDINPDISPGTKSDKQFMENTMLRAGDYNKRRGMIDDRITRGTNEYEITKLADKLCDDFSVGYERTKATLATYTAEAEAKVNAKTALSPTANASEIRSVLRAMPAAERSSAAVAAFKAGDKETIAAIVSAPAIIHGLDQQQVDALHEAFKRTEADAEYRVLDEHRKATKHLENFFPGLDKWQARAYHGTKDHAKNYAEKGYYGQFPT
jgi:hypothetical protein